MPGKYDFLQAWRQRVAASRAVVSIERRALDTEDYRGETAKIAEAIEACIKFLEIMQKQLSKSDPVAAGECLKLRDEIKQKTQELGIDSALKGVAVITIKRDVTDDEAMQKVDQHMKSINDMVDYLASIKPISKPQHFWDRSPGYKIASSSNMIRFNIEIAERSRTSLRNKVARLHTRSKHKPH